MSSLDLIIFSHLKSLEDHIPEQVSQLADIIGSGVQHPFFARIWKKSKIRYYGKTNEEKPYPLFYTLLITDKSTPKGVPVTIWNELALKTYADLNIGDVIIVNDYKVKSFYDSGVFSAKFKTEISINPSKSKVPIQKLDPSHLETVSGFATLNFPLSTIDSITIGKLNDAIVNVMGIVVNMGPYRREKFHSQYSQFRYITLVDPTSIQLISVKLYTNSRKPLMDALQMGQIILLTDLSTRTVLTA